MAEYVVGLADERRAALWSWFASLTPELRRGARVLDLSPGSDPGGFVGDEWQPVAEHEMLAAWLVRRG